MKTSSVAADIASGGTRPSTANINAVRMAMTSIVATIEKAGMDGRFARAGAATGFACGGGVARAVVANGVITNAPPVA